MAPDEQERRSVGHREVVENQDERPDLRGVPEERRCGVEQAEAGALGVRGHLGTRHLGEQVLDIWEHLGDVRGPSAELRQERVRVLLPEIRADRLHPRPVGWSAARLPAASPQDQGHALLCAVRELVREPALADPGLTTDEKEPPSTREEVVEAGLQLRHLTLPPQEDAFGRRSRGRVRILGRSNHREPVRRVSSSGATLTTRMGCVRFLTLTGP